MKIVVLGSGTSTGIPVLGCNCSVCRSNDSNDKRTRSSLAITFDNLNWIIIDTSPEFRLQALGAGISKVEAVLYTHLHADHCNGFDDLRAFSFASGSVIECFVASEYSGDFRSRFSYVFKQTGYKGAKPIIELKEIDSNIISLKSCNVEVFCLPHGHVTSRAFKIGRFMYATDFKGFSKEQIQLLRGKVDVMIASGIHFGKHSAHSTIPETIDLLSNLLVKRGFITHISHEVSYARDKLRLPNFVQFAYDNMVIEI